MLAVYDTKSCGAHSNGCRTHDSVDYVNVQRTKPSSNCVMTIHWKTMSISSIDIRRVLVQYWISIGRGNCIWSMRCVCWRLATIWNIGVWTNYIWNRVVSTSIISAKSTCLRRCAKRRKVCGSVKKKSLAKANARSIKSGCGTHSRNRIQI